MRAKNEALQFWKLSPKSWNYYWYLFFVTDCLQRWTWKIIYFYVAIKRFRLTVPHAFDKSMKSTRKAKVHLHIWCVARFGTICTICNFIKINTPPWVFFMFLKLHKWYQIVRRTTYLSSSILYFQLSIMCRKQC